MTYMDDKEREARQWAMFVHFSQFAGYVAPLAGFIAPIVLWQMKKDELPDVDTHGRIVVNWMISELIYGLICFVLIFVFIGIPLLFVLAILALLFPIIGGVKANNGEVWKYPLSIPFLRLHD